MPKFKLDHTYWENWHNKHKDIVRYITEQALSWQMSTEVERIAEKAAMDYGKPTFNLQEPDGLHLRGYGGAIQSLPKCYSEKFRRSLLKASASCFGHISIYPRSFQASNQSGIREVYFNGTVFRNFTSITFGPTNFLR